MSTVGKVFIMEYMICFIKPALRFIMASRDTSPLRGYEVLPYERVVCPSQELIEKAPYMADSSVVIRLPPFALDA